MKLTKKQKIYGGVLGLAVAGWAIGAAASGTPVAPSPPVKSATAGLATAAISRGKNPTTSNPGASAKVTPSTPLQSVLSDKLRTFLAADGKLPEVRDIFRPSELWVSARENAGAGSAQSFKQTHHLVTVLLGHDPGSGKAVVDGTLVAVGEEVDGFRLIEVGRIGAKFATKTQTVELRLDPQTAGR